MHFNSVGIRGNILGALLIAGGAFQVSAQEVDTSTTVSGIVKDAGTQTPIAGAFITLLSNPDMAAMTDADGKFTLTVVDPAGVRLGRGAIRSMQLRGTELSFATRQAGAYAHVTLHDLRGHELATLKNERLPEGEYTLSVAPANLPAGLYVVRAAIGGEARSFRMSTLGGGNSRFTRVSASPASARLAKAAVGGVDWVIVNKAGYLKKLHEIMAFKDAQTILLAENKPATADLGIFTDSAGMPQIDWANGAIYSWEQTSVLLADTAGNGFNGSKTSMNVSAVETASWNGWAFHVAALPNTKQPTVDLTPYAGGSLHLAVKGNSPSIGVMLSSTNQFAGTAPLIDLATKGYLPDSLWHEITIPVSEFSGEAKTLNLADVFVYCGFVSPSVQFSTFDPLATYTIDEVYFTPAP
jgi:hypothetical protein